MSIFPAVRTAVVAMALTALSLGAVSARAQSETSVSAPGPSGALAGTMTAPAAANAPLVLILPGSGPTDRDGNSPLGIRAAPYRLLAQALSERGVASVRVDKRGLAGSAAAGDGNAVTIAAYADDVRSWVEVLRAQTGLPCIWLAGHSEGGLIALFAARRTPGICGVITISAPGRRLGDLLREQLSAQLAGTPLLDQATAAIAALESGRQVDAAGLDPALRGLFAPAVQPYLIDLLSHDPAIYAAELRLPLLVVQGSTDLQTSVADARRIADAASDARLALIPGVNHVLKIAPGDDRAANLATYADPDRPLAPGVADAITDFILSHPQGDD